MSRGCSFQAIYFQQTRINLESVSQDCPCAVITSRRDFLACRASRQLDTIINFRPLNPTYGYRGMLDKYVELAERRCLRMLAQIPIHGKCSSPIFYRRLSSKQRNGQLEAPTLRSPRQPLKRGGPRKLAIFFCPTA